MLAVNSGFDTGLTSVSDLDCKVARQLVAAAQRFDDDSTVRAILVTGEGDKAFAAGADVKELAEQSYSNVRAAR